MPEGIGYGAARGRRRHRKTLSNVDRVKAPLSAKKEKAKRLSASAAKMEASLWADREIRRKSGSQKSKQKPPTEGQISADKFREAMPHKKAASSLLNLSKWLGF